MFSSNKYFFSSKVKTEPVNGSTSVNNNNHLKDDRELDRRPIIGSQQTIGQ